MMKMVLVRSLGHRRVDLSADQVHVLINLGLEEIKKKRSAEDCKDLFWKEDRIERI